MKTLLRNRLFLIGLGLLVLGSGPLWGIILLAEIGLWPDPDPNPVGPGLLFALSFWPALICLALGARQVLRQSRCQE